MHSGDVASQFRMMDRVRPVPVRVDILHRVPGCIRVGAHAQRAQRASRATGHVTDLGRVPGVEGQKWVWAHPSDEAWIQVSGAEVIEPRLLVEFLAREEEPLRKPRLLIVMTLAPDLAVGEVLDLLVYLAVFVGDPTRRAEVVGMVVVGRRAELVLVMIVLDCRAVCRGELASGAALDESRRVYSNRGEPAALLSVVFIDLRRPDDLRGEAGGAGEDVLGRGLPALHREELAHCDRGPALTELDHSLAGGVVEEARQGVALRVNHRPQLVVLIPDEAPQLSLFLLAAAVLLVLPVVLPDAGEAEARVSVLWVGFLLFTPALQGRG